MRESTPKGGPRYWFFPPFDQQPKNLFRGKICDKCGTASPGLRLEEGPFDLPTAQIAWSVELNAKRAPKSATLLLEQPPKARPPGKRKVNAACAKCGSNVLSATRQVLEARGMPAGALTEAAAAGKGLKKAPFKADLKAYGAADCLACGNSGRILFRPASRYRVSAATLRAVLPSEAGAAPSPLEITSAKKLEAVGNSEEISVSCGHCGKPLPKQQGRLKKKAVDAQETRAGAPSQADDLAYEAYSMLTSGRLNEALAVATRALEADRRQPRALLVGALANFKLRNFEAAVPMLKDLKKADARFATSNDADAWLGATYEAMGRLSEAASSFRAKLKQKPNDPSATLALARVLLLRDGPTGEGMKLLKAVSRIPVAKDRALVDPRLQTLRQHPAIRAVLGLG
ncbi:MAG: hypothetical protein ACK4N5_03230 [Myxococcales bacterium]